MNGKFKFLILILLVLPACQQVTPAFTCDDPLGCVTIAPDAPLKLGVLQDLSGKVPVLGQEQVRAVELALTKRNNQLMNHPLILAIQDEKCTQEGGAIATLKLIADPQIVGLIGPTCSPSAETASKIMSEAGLVMVSGTNTTASLTSLGQEKGTDWQAGYFRTSPNGTQPAQVIADFIFHELKLQKAATIDDGTSLTQGLTKVFQQSFTELGGEMVLKATVSKGDRDMQPVVTALAYSEAEVLLLAAFNDEANLIIHQINTMSKEFPGETLPLVGISLLVTDNFLQDIGENGVGSYFVVQGTLNSLDEEYKARYGEAPTAQFYNFTYDATNLLLHAIEQVAIQDPDGTLYIGRQALRDALYATVDLKGVTGRLSCNQFGDCSGVKNKIVRFDDATAGADAVRSNIIYPKEMD